MWRKHHRAHSDAFYDVAENEEEIVIKTENRPADAKDIVIRPKGKRKLLRKQLRNTDCYTSYHRLVVIGSTLIALMLVAAAVYIVLFIKDFNAHPVNPADAHGPTYAASAAIMVLNAVIFYASILCTEKTLFDLKLRRFSLKNHEEIRITESGISYSFRKDSCGNIRHSYILPSSLLEDISYDEESNILSLYGSGMETPSMLSLNKTKLPSEVDECQILLSEKDAMTVINSVRSKNLYSAKKVDETEI